MTILESSGDTPGFEAVKRVAQLLDQEGKAPSLAQLALETGYSPGHLQRVFKQAIGLSPAEFARAIREARAIVALDESPSVTDAIYRSGYDSPARFYEAMNRRLGMTPSAWRRGGEGVRIGWQIAESSLGPMLLAATEKGICRLAFGENLKALEERFPNAELVQGGLPAELISQVLDQIDHGGDASAISLDVAGTPFQRRVWRALKQIPAGETRSYAEIALAIGQPKASRAVGSANGANPVAVVIPCHRVISADGGLGGYAWGEEIKRELLRRETQVSP